MFDAYASYLPVEHPLLLGEDARKFYLLGGGYVFIGREMVGQDSASPGVEHARSSHLFEGLYGWRGSNVVGEGEIDLDVADIPFFDRFAAV